MPTITLSQQFNEFIRAAAIHFQSKKFGFKDLTSMLGTHRRNANVEGERAYMLSACRYLVSKGYIDVVTGSKRTVTKTGALRVNKQKCVYKLNSEVLAENNTLYEITHNKRNLVDFDNLHWFEGYVENLVKLLVGHDRESATAIAESHRVSPKPGDIPLKVVVVTIAPSAVPVIDPFIMMVDQLVSGVTGMTAKDVFFGNTFLKGNTYAVDDSEKERLQFLFDNYYKREQFIEFDLPEARKLIERFNSKQTNKARYIPYTTIRDFQTRFFIIPTLSTNLDDTNKKYQLAPIVKTLINYQEPTKGETKSAFELALGTAHLKENHDNRYSNSKSKHA